MAMIVRAEPAILDAVLESSLGREERTMARPIFYWFVLFIVAGLLAS